jgi:hypothetical protein
VTAEAADIPEPPIATFPELGVRSEPRRHQLPLPSEFFNVHVHDFSRPVSLLGLCAGFESGSWRARPFAGHLMNYLIEFALTADEWQRTNAINAFRHLQRAARTVYATEKYENRGEVGELLLHAIMRRFIPHGFEILFQERRE